ncbi:MAG: hypothetical protein ACLFPQ_03490 [Candidatus Woesearchaeota archaeon]
MELKEIIVIAVFGFFFLAGIIIPIIFYIIKRKNKKTDSVNSNFSIEQGKEIEK